MRSRSITTLAACAALVCSVLAPATAAHASPPADAGGSAQATASSTRFVKLWTAAWMGQATSYTEQQAVDLARRTSVIAATGRMFEPYVAQMKAANPSLRILAYKNATFGRDGFPSDMYARDRAGRRIVATDWPDTYLMKLSDPRWRSDVARSCDYLVRTSGYDGCFLDVLGSGPLTAPRYLSSVPVINGGPWTANQWISWTVDIVDQVRASYPAMPVSGNGLGDGSRYFDTSQDPRPLVPVLDSAMPELFLRSPQAGVNSYRSESAWRKDVDMVLDVQRQGRTVVTMTKLWVDATAAQKRAWHAYALASFMLASNGTSKFAFLPDHTTSAPLLLDTYNSVDIGTPLSGYAKSGGVYRRPFTAGLALVNPTTASVTVTLARPYMKLNGTVVSGSLTLGPNTGEVLKFA